MNFNKTLNVLSALVLGASIKRIYNDILLANIELTDEGFYCDFFKSSDILISTNDFNKIEKEMKKIISGAYEIKPIAIDKQYFKDNKFALELIEQNPNIKCYKLLDQYYLIDYDLDLKTNLLKFFKLLNVGGVYWQSNAKNDSLIRISGSSFDNNDDLEKYLLLLEERKERDHRKIGKDLKLFTFNNLCGPGMPIFLPNGAKIKRQLENFIHQLQFEANFDFVQTPVLANVDLYKKSGHWDHYHEYMFPPMEVEDERICLRPMTCPHHILIYSNEPKSYKQLPIRYAEPSNLFRYESSGGLTGLERVRSMILEDTHIFCTPDQIKQEVHNCYLMIKKAYDALNIELSRIDLSCYDPENKEKFHDDKLMWESSQKQLRQMLEEEKINFFEIKGEAAFYGPKIDFQIKTNLGRLITVSTIQLDFLLPEKFDISYKDKNGNLVRPVMIHLGLLGTYERLLSILLEQTKGKLPLWLSPNQIIIIPVNNQIHSESANKLLEKFKSYNIRCLVDDREERLSKKIREAQIQKIPYQIVIGDNELANPNIITYREYGSDSETTVDINEFINKLLESIKNYK